MLYNTRVDFCISIHLLWLHSTGDRIAKKEIPNIACVRVCVCVSVGGWILYTVAAVCESSPVRDSSGGGLDATVRGEPPLPSFSAATRQGPAPAAAGVGGGRWTPLWPLLAAPAKTREPRKRAPSKSGMRLQRQRASCSGHLQGSFLFHNPSRRVCRWANASRLFCGSVLRLYCVGHRGLRQWRQQ
jgi:hypothetical protein